MLHLNAATICCFLCSCLAEVVIVVFSMFLVKRSMLKSCAESVAVLEVCRNVVCHGETRGRQYRSKTFAISSGPLLRRPCFEKARAPLASHGSLCCAAMSLCLFTRFVEQKTHAGNNTCTMQRFRCQTSPRYVFMFMCLWCAMLLV